MRWMKVTNFQWKNKQKNLHKNEKIKNGRIERNEEGSSAKGIWETAGE